MRKIMLLVAIVAFVVIGSTQAYAIGPDLEVTDISLSKRTSFDVCEPITITATIKENYPVVPEVEPGLVSPILGRQVEQAKEGVTAVDVPAYAVTFYYYRDEPAEKVLVPEKPAEEIEPVAPISPVFEFPIIGRILQAFIVTPEVGVPEAELYVLPSESETGEKIREIGEVNVIGHKIYETTTKKVTFKYWPVPKLPDNLAFGAYVDLGNANKETRDQRENNDKEKHLISISDFVECANPYSLADGEEIVLDMPVCNEYDVNNDCISVGTARFKVYTNTGTNDKDVNLKIENMDAFIDPNTTYDVGEYVSSIKIGEKDAAGTFGHIVSFVTLKPAVLRSHPEWARIITVPNVEAAADGTVTKADVCIYQQESVLHIVNPNGGETFAGNVPIEWCGVTTGDWPNTPNIGWVSTDPNVIAAYGHDPARVDSVADNIKFRPASSPYIWDGKGVTAPFKKKRLPDGKYKIYISDTDNLGAEDYSDNEFTITTLRPELVEEVVEEEVLRAPEEEAPTEGAPDLVVKSIGVAPSAPRTGDTMTVSVVVENRGDVDGVLTPEGFRPEIPWLCWAVGADCYENPTYSENPCSKFGGVCTPWVGPEKPHCTCSLLGGLESAKTLAPGESTAISFTLIAPEEGTHEIIIRLDPENKIVELNEENNVRSGIISVAARPAPTPLLPVFDFFGWLAGIFGG